MAGDGFASLPKPPYYAVIFASRRHGDDDSGYAEAAAEMTALAQRQPGFLGMESARDAAGFGITVSYWACEQAILDWRQHAEHRLIRERGRQDWYDHYELRVAKVERAYGWNRE